MSEKNIFQRMEAITAELKIVAKNLEVGTGRSSYRAVSERDIIDAVKPIEAKHGIYSYPSSREIIESRTIERENGTPIFFTRFKTIYTFVNIDNPSEKLSMCTFSEGIDTGDKGCGKAMTYGDKYALMKAYKISTGEDPDQEPSPEEHPEDNITADQVGNLEKLIKDSGTSRDGLIAWIQQTLHKQGLEFLSTREYAAIYERLNENMKKRYGMVQSDSKDNAKEQSPGDTESVRESEEHRPNS